MKYKNNLYAGILILIIVLMTILVDIKETSTIEPFYIFLLVIPLAIIISSLIKTNTSKQIMKNGEKQKGYIIDVEYWSIRDYFTQTGAVKVYVNGKIQRINKIEVDDKYKKLYDRINSMYYVDENINIKGIPVDVYIDNNQVYVDLESIEV
jgi:hypothetical protein